MSKMAQSIISRKFPFSQNSHLASDQYETKMGLFKDIPKLDRRFVLVLWLKLESYVASKMAQWDILG